MKRILHSLLLFLFLLITHTSSLAESRIIGISTGYPPYYYEKDGVLTGFCIEMVNAVAEQLGIEIKYEVFPWMRLIRSARKGHVDAIMPLFRTEERTAFLIFDDLELAPETNNFFAAKTSSISYNQDLEELQPYRIGVVEGYSYGSVFDNFSFHRKEETKNDKHLVEMFIHNRFDVGIGNKFVVLHYAKLLAKENTIHFFEPPITSETLYMGVVRNEANKEFALSFAKTLKSFKASPSYRQLVKKYGIKR